MWRSWHARLDVAFLIGLLALSAAIWFGRAQVSAKMIALMGADDASSPAGRSEPPPAPVIVARIGRETDAEIVETVGTARARRAVMLMPKADGELVKLTVQPGARVTAGQPLFSVDDTQARLAVSSARQKLADAQRTLQRVTFLKRRNINSQASVDDQRSAVTQAEVELAQAQATLRDHTVSAPFDGIVGIPKLEVGDRVDTSKPILSVDDRSELIVEFNVPERFLPKIAVGSPLSVTTPAYRDRRFDGTVSAVDSRIDPETRFFVVRATVPNADDALRPGMSFRVALAIEGTDRAAVPELALQWRDGTSFVWIVQDGKAQRVDVAVLKRLSDRVLVQATGLEPGQLVVVEGVHRLRPDRTVAFAAPVPPQRGAGSGARAVEQPDADDGGGPSARKANATSRSQADRAGG